MASLLPAPYWCTIATECGIIGRVDVVVVAAAALSVGASCLALITAAVLVRTERRARGAVEAGLDRITHQLAALDQAWYWTPEWQAGEAEADDDLAAGRLSHHDTSEDFLAALRNIPAADDPVRAQ
jgi:hypothetical protein